MNFDRAVLPTRPSNSRHGEADYSRCTQAMKAGLRLPPPREAEDQVSCGSGVAELSRLASIHLGGEEWRPRRLSTASG